jgi:hypothetical protein
LLTKKQKKNRGKRMKKLETMRQYQWTPTCQRYSWLELVVNLKVGDLDLGFHPPFKATKVPNLNKFTYDKGLGKIARKSEEVLMTGGNPISVVTQTLVTKDVKEYLITIVFTSSTFMSAKEDNIQTCANKI